MSELSDAEKRAKRLELGREAKAMLESKTFQGVITHLVSEQVGILAGAAIGSLTATTAHATLLALNQIKDQLRVLANELKVEEKKRG